MDEKMNYLNPKELVDGGYLQEVNRRFFHPLGLALATNPDQDTEGGWFAVQVWDYRDDPEGFEFGQYEGAYNKAEKIDKELESKVAARRKMWPLQEICLEGWIQPIETMDDLPDEELL